MTFRHIGEALGSVLAIDLDNGRVQVVVDGFKPLCFETSVEFHGGDETVVHLRYERLFGFCRICLSMCHDSATCPQHGGKGERSGDEHKKGSGSEATYRSYRGVVTYGQKEVMGVGGGCELQGKSKGKERDLDRDLEQRGHESYKDNKRLKYREGSSRGQQRLDQGHKAGKNQRYVLAAIDGKQRVNSGMSEALVSHEEERGQMVPVNALQELIAEVNQSGVPYLMPEEAGDVAQLSKEIRKDLSFEDEPILTEQTMQYEPGMTSEMGNNVMVDEGLDLTFSEFVENMFTEPMREKNILVNERYSGETMFESPDLEDGEVTMDSGEMKAGNTQVALEAMQENVNVDLQDQSANAEGYGTNGEGMVERKEVPEGKKKTVKGSSALVGVCSKKRNVQNLISPRKKIMAKSMGKLGEGMYPKEGNGKHGDPKPPKPVAG